MKDKRKRMPRGQLDLLPREGPDWSRLETARRVWLEDVGGDHGARLEFLASQGLRLVLADLCPGVGETLHLSNAGDNETLHLRAGGGKSLLPEASKYFPAASRWMELLHGGDGWGSLQPAGTAHPLAREGLILEVEGGRVRRVSEAWMGFPQGVLHGAKASQAALLLEREAGMAFSLAFLQALEDARGMKVPETAVAFRAALLELARAQAHLEWFRCAASVLGRRRTAARCGGLLQELAAAAGEWLGDPQGRGCAVPGGVREGLPLEEAAPFTGALAASASAWEELSRRVVSLPVPGWAERRLADLRDGAEGSAWVGPMARAAGLDRDARMEEPGACEVVDWERSVPPEGVGMLRSLLAVKAGEVASSLDVARRILAEPPDAPLLAKRGRGGRGEGFGRCEGPDGEVCCHVVLEKGQVRHAAFSLPLELNRSAARVLAGCRLDEVDILSLLWESRPSA